MGQLDVHILAEVLGGDRSCQRPYSSMERRPLLGRPVTQRQDTAEQNNTKSLAFFYLSEWKNPASAQDFAKLYADNLGRKYSSVNATLTLKSRPLSDNGDEEQVFQTEEGPVVITTRGSMVFVSESFPLDLARKLTTLILDAQGTGEMRMAQTTQPAPALSRPAMEPLTGDLVHFFENAGVMKAAVDAAVQAGK